MKELTESNFEKGISKGNLLVNFYAHWCAPCQALSPILSLLSKEYIGKIEFCKIDVDSANKIADKFNIRGIPCMIFFRDGREIDRIVGLLPQDGIRKRLDSLLIS